MHTELSKLIYNGIDSAVTHKCADTFFSEIDSQNHRWTYDFTVDLLEPLMYFMHRGLKVNVQALKDESARVHTDIERKQDELNKLAGGEINPLSPKQMQQYFYGKLGVNPYTTTAKDAHGNKVTRISTNDAAMQRMVKGTATRKPIPEAKLVQELRGLHKLKGTYLDINLDTDHRLRCSYNPRGTRFGRLSSSATVFNTGTNLQNLPPSFKKFIEADPGYILWELDKAQAEWVVCAFASGDENMMMVCKEGKDPHAYTASRMFNLPEDIIKHEAKILGHETDPDIIDTLRMEASDTLNLINQRQVLPRNMSMRQAGKKSNHGLNYQETYRMFALHNEMLEKDAKTIVELYHSIYPGLQQWYNYIERKLAEDRTLENCFGRKYKFLNRWNKDLFKAATSFIPQSTVSDLVNRGIIGIYNDTDPCMEYNEMLSQVHDSILGQYPIPITDEDFERLADCMLRCKDHLNPIMEYNTIKFTIDTDLKIGTTWGHMMDIDINTDRNKLIDQLKIVIGDICVSNQT